MMARVLILILGLCVAPLSWSRDVYPPSVKNLPSIELGQAVLLLMPIRGSKFVGWDHLSEGPVVWLNEGYVTEKRWGYNTAGGVIPEYTTSIRRGLMRIHVLGKKATVLKKRKLELAWQVTYENRGNPNLSLDLIKLEPAGCFGELNTGCTFDPIPSFKASGIRVKEICRTQPSSDFMIVFKLSHAERKTTYASLIWSGGSGGESTTITLWIDEKLGCPLDD